MRQEVAPGAREQAASARPTEAVLVTGCSSGIGRACALALARNGYLVLATVRTESARASLNGEGLSGLIPLCPLDLREPSHVPPIVERVQAELASRGIEGLRAIVNNAGGGFIAPVELMEPDRLADELNARVVGPVRLLVPLLPLLRAGRGRVLWISTPGLVPVPYVSSIHIGEFAARCLAQTLAIELAPWRIANVVIACGGIDTPAVERSERELAEAIGRWPADRVALYADSLERTSVRLHRFDATRIPVARVAQIVLGAVRARTPRALYRAGSGALAMALLRLLPEAVVIRALRRLI